MGTVYEKQIFIKNVRHLLENSDIKLGDIEEEAGCSKGYFSRVEGGMIKNVGIEFVLTAAKQFNVYVEDLLYSDLTELNSTNRMVLSFITKLGRDTKAGNLKWDITNQDFHSSERHLPSKKIRESIKSFFKRGENGEEIFVSPFLGYGEDMTDLISCHARLDNDSNWAALICYKRESMQIYEFYLVEGGTVVPLVNNIGVSEVMKRELNELYLAIDQSKKSVQLSPGVKGVIEQYLNA